jgi:DNA (cytosine-5)-methyltransferase 1
MAGGTIVDLFSGCGGFSLGAELAGFRSLASIDVDGTLQSAYRRNFPGARAIQASVADIDASDWRHFLGKLRPDGVIGGPPCQGFSWIGKRRSDDPRNSLLYHFFRHIEVLRPKFFVMENVEGLLCDDRIGLLHSAIERIAGTYRVLEPFVVNAAQFGAATNRRRVVVIGYDPADVDQFLPKALTPRAPRKLVTVRDAIADLPLPIPDTDEGNFSWTKYPLERSRRLSGYARRLRRLAPVGLGWREGVEHHRAGYVSGMVATRHSEKVATRYATLHGGGTDRATKSFRLKWNGQCPTLRAGTGADKGSFQAVRPLHPKVGRVITVREAARLQGFPDWFVFHPTKWHSFRMIGNSVSPLLAHGLLARLRSLMHVSTVR